MGKIVFVFEHLGIGGVSKSLSFVANICANNGYEVKVICFSEDKQTIKLDKKIEIIKLGYEANTVNSKNTIFKIIKKIKLLIKLRKVIIKENPQSVCVFRIDLVRIVTLALIGKQYKIVGSERGNPFIFKGFSKQKYKLAAKKCNKFVCQTIGASKFYDNIAKEKLAIIPNPCIPRKKEVKIYEGKRKNNVILCGRLSVEKNFDIAIKAFSEVLKKYDEYEMHIYGDGPENHRLLDLIENLDVSENIKIMNKCDDVFQIAYDSGMFLICSEYEGMPNALMEAMSIGIPSIAVNSPPGGIKEVTGNGERALLIKDYDVNTIYEAIIYFIENKLISDKFGNKGLEINQIYSKEKIGKEWLNLINLLGE